MNRLVQLSALLRLILADLGTVSLGAAAILVTRAIPTAELEDLNAGLLIVSAFFALLGIALRVISRAQPQ